MQSSDGTPPWCPGQSLWCLIAEHISGSELPKIQAALGTSLVSQYRDLHAEAEMWYKLMQEGRSKAGTPSLAVAPLADPPTVKELLRGEVKMLLQNLREKASSEGGDGEKFMLQYKPEMVAYALNHPGGSCKLGSRDSGNSSRPGSLCSVQSTAEDEVEAVRDKLNITDIDQVVKRLRSVLVEQCRELNTLIKHLKGLIKEMCRGRRQKPEPTLSELRELRGAIQKDLKLYPSLAACSPGSSHTLQSKDSKHLRSPADPAHTEETLGPVRTSRVASPLAQTLPRPPSSAPCKASASSKRLNRSFVPGIAGQHIGRRSHSPPPEITNTTAVNKITSSRSSSSLSSCASERTTVKIPKQCASPAETSGSPSRSRTFPTNAAGGSAAHVTLLPSEGRPGKKCDLFPPGREDGNSRLACTSSSISGLGPQRSTGSRSSSSRNDGSVSAARKSKTQSSATLPVGTV